MFEAYDEQSVMPGPFRLYKFADVVFDLCRDYEERIAQLERKIEDVEAYQREQMER